MPRPRKASDAEILEQALTLMEQRGADAVTFANLARRSGLAGATLVQRFGSKQGLVDAALARAWEALEERTRRFAAEEPETPDGAVAVLCRLSRDYGDIHSYADKLRILREDLRNPVFRARGAAWVGTLAELMQACFPKAAGEVGVLMVAQWQGALLLWAFAPDQPLDAFVRRHLERFLASAGLRGR